MDINIQRFDHLTDSTIGHLYLESESECFTLEDERREVKVMGETRIPEGSYKIKLRTKGGFHNRYKKRFPQFHKGMLELQDVPNFKYILIHCGNTDKDTAGCILVGQKVSKHDTLVKSKDAYISLYKKVIAAIEKGEEVVLNISSVNQ
jgi:hypothetical protein